MWYRQRPESVKKIDEKFREFLLKHTKKSFMRMVRNEALNSICKHNPRVTEMFN